MTVLQDMKDLGNLCLAGYIMAKLIEASDRQSYNQWLHEDSLRYITSGEITLSSDIEGRPCPLWELPWWVELYRDLPVRGRNARDLLPRILETGSSLRLGSWKGKPTDPTQFEQRRRDHYFLV